MSVWECSYCGMRIHRNPSDPVSEAWVEERIAACERVHAKQLADYDGDEESLRFHLRNPAFAAAIDEVRIAEKKKEKLAKEKKK